MRFPKLRRLSQTQIKDSVDFKEPADQHAAFESLESRILFTDVAIAYVSKADGFYQPNDSSVVSSTNLQNQQNPGFDFSSGVQLNSGGSLLSASLTFPDSTVDQMSYNSQDSQWELSDQTFASLSAMDTAVPAGNYALAVDATNDGQKTFNLAMPSDEFPNTPQLTTGDFDGLQTLNATQAYTLTWNPFSGGNSNDFIQLKISDSNGNSVLNTPGPEASGGMTGTATSYNIPSGTMTNGDNYIIQLTFYNIAVMDSVDYPGSLGGVAYQTRTDVPVFTAATTLAPTGVSASQGAYPHHVTLNWNTVEDATGYQIYRSTDSNFADAVKIGGGVTATTYNDNTAVAGQQYYYWVRGRNPSGLGTLSSPITGFVPLPPPATISSEAFPHHVQLTWAAVTGATGYQVFRSTTNNSAGATKIASGITTTFFNDNTAQNGVTYFYWVRARDAAGIGLFSVDAQGSLS